jgi:hypothetical protein
MQYDTNLSNLSVGTAGSGRSSGTPSHNFRGDRSSRLSEEQRFAIRMSEEDGSSGVASKDQDVDIDCNQDLFKGTSRSEDFDLDALILSSARQNAAGARHSSS